MYLTKECDYGLRIVRALSAGDKKNAEEICVAEHIPGQYVYKILKKLDRAGIVKSSRGRDGGYKLAASPDAFSIYDVVSSIDGNLFVNECLRKDHDCLRNSTGHPCAVHKELERIQLVLVSEMRKKSMTQVIVEGKDSIDNGYE